MPTLTRFLIIVLILGGIAYGAMFSLVAFTEPASRQMSHPISDDRFNR